MPNEIKKIILSMDESRLKGIIVIRNNSIKSYGYSKVSQDELLNIYSENVRELKELYKSELYGLSSQDAINKLYLLGKLEYNIKNLITSIRLYSLGTIDEKIVVLYENNKEEYKLNSYTNIDDYKKIKENKLNELSSQFNVSRNYLERLGLLKIDNNLNEIFKENKIKNFVIKNKKVLSMILTFSITVTGIGVGIYKLSKKNNFNNLEQTNKQEIYINTLVPTITNNPNIVTNSTSLTNTVTPILPKMEDVTPPPIKLSREIIFFGNYDLNRQEPISSKVLAKKIYGNILYLKKDDIEDIKNSLNEIRKSNIKYILNNKELDFKENNDLLIIYYENFLENNNLTDKVLIKYFSNIGNKIIENAFNNNELIKYAKISGQEAIRIIQNNEALEVLVNGEVKKVYYDDLSLDAKELILNIIWNNNMCLIDNESISYNSETYTSFDIDNIILSEKDVREKISLFEDSDGNIDSVKYEKSLEIFRKMVIEFYNKYYDYIENNPNIKINIEDNYQELLVNYDILSDDSNKDYIIKNYKSSKNPFKTRFSQGTNGYGNVNFEGKSIKKSGCGICAFATGVSCGLTLQYDENILVNPKVLLKELKSLPVKHSYRGSNGLNWGASFSYISKDITEVFKDISIIELERCTPTFNTQNLTMITNNYPVVVSLNGRGHIVCVTKNNGNDKYYVADSDRGYSSPIGIKTYIVRSDGKKRGTIFGKKAWIIIPNKNITINNNEIIIKGLDLSKLPSIARFETNGHAYEVSIDVLNNSLVLPMDINKEENISINK